MPSGPSAANSSAYSPLSELLLSPSQIQEAASAMRTRGFYELAMHQVSLEFLKSVPSRAQAAGFSKTWALDKTIDHPLSRFGAELSDGFEDRLSGVIQELVKTLCQLETQPELVALEFVVREPERSDAAKWHIDEGPKVLTIFGTVEGDTTQYISPPHDVEAVDLASTSDKVSDPLVLAQHMNSCKLGHFYWVGAAGLRRLGEGRSVPLLVHAAPGKENRKLFLARWRPGR